MISVAARAAVRRPELVAPATELLGRSIVPAGECRAAIADRAGRADLYYTMFGLECALALSGTGFPAPASAGGTGFPTCAAAGTEPGCATPDPLPRLFWPYLASFDPATLDLVHLACLARAWRAVQDLAAAEGSATRPPIGLANAVAKRLADFACPGGGFHLAPAAPAGSTYGCFVALGLLQDLGLPVPRADGIVACLARCRNADGGYGLMPGAPSAANPTAAALLVMLELGATDTPPFGVSVRGRPGATAAEFAPVPPAPNQGATDTPPLSFGVSVRDGARRTDTANDAVSVAPKESVAPKRSFALGTMDFLRRQYDGQGFRALPFAPSADLLSTATAIHALAEAGADLSPFKACLEYALALNFRGHAADTQADCEFLFYTLLVVGHLA